VAASDLRLAWRGRLVAAAFVLPGLAASMFSLYLPNSDQGGVFSVSAMTFYLGGLVVLTGPAWALMYAFQTPSLRRIPDHAAWRERRVERGPAFPVTAGLGLVAANALAAAWFAVLTDHARIEQATTALFGLAALTHLALTLRRHR
jgi:hypothetical protein